jgi:undecaprenyl diphosphate synthase
VSGTPRARRQWWTRRREPLVIPHLDVEPAAATTRQVPVRAERTPPEAPPPHPTGVQAPRLRHEVIPKHVAIVMDGNGRWANARGLPRTEGHRAGEAALIDVVAGAIEVGVTHVSAYAFSTENWKRSPDEVRFLMNFNRDVIRRRRDLLDSWGVRIRWAGRRPRLWPSVVDELQVAERVTEGNTVCTLTMCVNYGGRSEITDALIAIAREVKAGRIAPDSIDEWMVARHLDEPDLPDVDMFWRVSGEWRLSNFMLWQSAYAEMVFTDDLWPDVDRRHLWAAVQEYARRDRRFGGAIDQIGP